MVHHNWRRERTSTAQPPLLSPTPPPYKAELTQSEVAAIDLTIIANMSLPPTDESVLVEIPPCSLNALIHLTLQVSLRSPEQLSIWADCLLPASDHTFSVAEAEKSNQYLDQSTGASPPPPFPREWTPLPPQMGASSPLAPIPRQWMAGMPWTPLAHQPSEEIESPSSPLPTSPTHSPIPQHVPYFIPTDICNCDRPAGFIYCIQCGWTAGKLSPLN